MDQNTLEKTLADLGLGAVRYYDRLGSTNDEAASWASQNAPDLALVVANEQTSGRGRAGRTWYTHPGGSLAFSLVLHPPRGDAYLLPRLTALGALAVCDALRKDFSLAAQIKWPNDVLVNRSKVAGVLAEVHWTGEELSALILGIGINVLESSAGNAVLDGVELPFPVTSVEAAFGHPVDRLKLLHSVLAGLIAWRPRLAAPQFLQAWEANLAFRGEWVQMSPGQSPGKDGLPSGLEKLPPPIHEGQILGLAPDGSLKLRTRSGETVTVRSGEVRLRPVGQN
ncbi:MAG: biotin--[acetyl-CoA-carboxylase] ligase [Chloroflexota bacterium]|nr:MAG: biotin--[acetyl-CoA-carboxylase] ligase [Chloroflexota bacterium]